MSTPEVTEAQRDEMAARLIGTLCAGCEEELTPANLGLVGLFVPDHPEEYINAPPRENTLRAIGYGVCRRHGTDDLPDILKKIEARLATGEGAVDEVIDMRTKK